MILSFSLTMVFTAPTFLAIPLTSSQALKALSLCGTVTFAPLNLSSLNLSKSFEPSISLSFM